MAGLEHQYLLPQWQVITRCTRHHHRHIVQPHITSPQQPPKPSGPTGNAPTKYRTTAKPMEAAATRTAKIKKLSRQAHRSADIPNWAKAYHLIPTKPSRPSLSSARKPNRTAGSPVAQHHGSSCNRGTTNESHAVPATPLQPCARPSRQRTRGRAQTGMREHQRQHTFCHGHTMPDT
jgi:hypothetical protein